MLHPLYLAPIILALTLAGCGGDGGSSDTSDPRTFGLDPGEGDTTIFCDNEGEGSQICFDGDGNRIDSPSDDDSDDDVELAPTPIPGGD